MRRYATISVVLLLLAAFVAAWVNAQEGVRRRVSPLAAGNGGDFAPRAPQRFSASDQAQPIDGPTLTDANDYIDEDSVQTAAGPGEDSVGEPEEAPLVARRPTRGSRLGPTVMPAAPVAEPPMNIDGEVDGGQPLVSPNMPSVLKKRAGTPPSAAVQSREPRLTPTTIGIGESEGGSSRRSLPAPRPMGRPPEVTAKATPTVTPVESQMLQVSGTSPRLTVQATGPQAVTVGKPADYIVGVANDSEAAADDVQVRIALPQWVNVAGGEGTRGEAKAEKDSAGRQWLVWTIDRLAANAQEQLSLSIVVTQNQPFELGLNWSAKPVALAAQIEVREPQVEVRLEGPSDMLFGETKTFTLHVSNPGSGDAEGVVVEVASGGQPNRLEVGTLPAGQSKQIPFSVAATAPGEMEIRATASGAGSLSAEAASRVIVHKPELQVAIDVPPLKFAGAESSYQVAVANVGDAVAEQVTLSIVLPSGAKYIGGLDGAAKAGEGLTLKVGSLSPNTEKVFEVRCVLTQAGENHFDVTAQGKGDLLAASSATTQVEALADLKLQVIEPTTPVAVGGEAFYEVRVTNRGTKSAEKVKVVVQFAQGIDPLEVEGGNANVANGQAVFEPLVEVAAGQEVVLKVKAKSAKAGNHAFRVEVKSGDETKLVSEGVTRCYADSAAGRATARKPGQLIPAPATKIR